MNKYTKRVLFYLFWLCAVVCHAQSNRLYTIQHGLVTCDINSLTLDSRGLLWIGGNSPICFFGGKQFHYLDNHDPKTGKVLYNNIKQVVEDQDHCYWLLTDGGLFYLNTNLNTNTRINLSPEECDENHYATRQMINLDHDGKQKLVMTEGYGIFVLNTKSKTIDRKLTAKLQELANEGFVTCAFRDSKNNLWISRINRSVVRINLSTLKATEIATTPEAQSLASALLVNSIVEVSSRQTMYFATDGGILRYDEQEQVLQLITGSNRITFTSFIYTRDGMLLAGSDGNGLWTIDEQDHVEPYLLTEPFFDLSKAKIKDITMDAQGNILIAIMQKGLYVIPNRSNEFRYYPISLKADGRNTSCITSITRDEHGHYWIATDGAGVFMSETASLDGANPVNEGLRSLQMQSMVIDKRGVIWVGSYGGGLQCHVEGTPGFTTPSWLTHIQNMPIMSICYDEKTDRIYLATNGIGAMVVDLAAQKADLLSFSEQPVYWLSDIHMDTEGTLWVNEANNVYYTQERTNKKGVLPKTILPGSPICLASTMVNGEKRVLIGTTEGLLVYNDKTGETNHLLKGKKIQSINTNGNEIWLATTNTICNIDLSTEQTKEYSNFGGFFLGEFHKRAVLRVGDDELYWGCDNGILNFSSEAMKQPHRIHNKVVFTSLIVNGKRVTYSEDSKVLDANILMAKKLTLPYDQNTFTVTFGIPDFSESPNMVFEYILEGYDKSWNTTTGERIHYSSLTYKTYRLRVRACIDGKADEATEQVLTIKVNAPWYATGWAKLTYILTFLLLSYAFWKNIKIRRKRIRELNESRRMEELKEAKLRLFTSITHELRAPLTMIVTPLRSLISTTDDEKLRNNLTIMQHNCNRLLNTVGQITDIRKIDAGQFQLHFEEKDLHPYTQFITKSFMGAIDVKKIQFSDEYSDEHIYAWIDPVHFEKVIVNILSNALKFTPNEGHISLKTERLANEVTISIYNDGQQIQKEDLSHLCERFFQSSAGKLHAGSGIGLNLCYELMQLHHGSIEARNVSDTGVEFIVHLPLGHKHLSAEELSPRTQTDESYQESQEPHNEEMLTAVAENLAINAKTESENKPVEENVKPRVLIVDDDKELNDYLYEQLHNDYNVLKAFGGNTAWEIVKKHRPDIVITDVMMVDGDGIELAQRIKSNPELDNIPIIMVTGEDDETLQLQSLKLNVDHFLQKPFSISILIGAIQQALGVRENTIKHTKRSDFVDEYGKMEMSSAEENLYNRITQTLQQHLDDSEYGVRELAEEVGISRVHLNRKMKERFGLSPNTFIKSFRLKQSAYLLINNQVNVSEVAYKVGFSTHSHFSSSFRDFFGMPPKEFVAYYTQEENKEALKKLLE